MTVKQLKRLVKELPNDMEVLILHDQLLITACKENSQIAEIETEDGVKEVLLMVPCSCHEEIESEVSPELN